MLIDGELELFLKTILEHEGLELLLKTILEHKGMFALSAIYIQFTQEN